MERGLRFQSPDADPELGGRASPSGSGGINHLIRDLGQSRPGSSGGIAYYLAAKPGCRSQCLFGVLGSLVVNTSSGYGPALGLTCA